MAAGPEDLSRICASCGLCCNGTLFGLVDLAPHEIATAKKNRLPVLIADESGAVCFTLPCPRHVGGEGCSIYAERPAVCAGYECFLLTRARNGSPVERETERARRARELLAKCRAAGVVIHDAVREGLSRAQAGIPVAPETAELLLDFAELKVILARDYGAADG